MVGRRGPGPHGASPSTSASPAGQELFRRLAATADVVCENFRPGAMERWGIGPDDCDPRLVWARISVFGQDGPYSGRTGSTGMGIAYGGLLHLTGYPDRPPVRPGVSISDYLTGTFAASAVAAALYRRDGPAAPGAAAWSTPRCTARSCGSSSGPWPPRTGSGITREREGNRMATSAPLDNYPTADGTFVCIVAGSDANFRRLCAAMGRPELADDPQWATLAKRAARSDEINDLVAAWTSPRTAAEVEAACIAHEVPVGTAYTRPTSWPTPTWPPAATWSTVDDPVAGPHRQQAPFPRLDGSRPPCPAAAPRLGEHNDEVWRDLVGLTDDELADLGSRGVV